MWVLFVFLFHTPEGAAASATSTSGVFLTHDACIEAAEELKKHFEPNGTSVNIQYRCLSQIGTSPE